MTVSVMRATGSSPSFNDLYGVITRARGSFDFVNKDEVMRMALIVDLNQLYWAMVAGEG